MKTILTFSLMLISVISFAQMSFNKELTNASPEIELYAADDETPISMSDMRDGRSYEIVELNGKIWMSENLKFKSPSSFCYDFSEENCDKYGRLYLWKEAQNVCPDGWHLPTDKEWDDLVKSLDGTYIADTKSKLLETDISEFVIGGWMSSTGNFYNLQEKGYFWTSTEFDEKFAWYRYIESANKGLYSAYHNKKYAFSVRCVQN